jgi:mono/diheme cytochrome c family protein
MKRSAAGLAAAAMLVLGACGGGDSGDKGNPQTQIPSGNARTQPTQQAVSGKKVFTGNCGACHTLAEAGTKGQRGPNLDDLKPDVATVQRQVINGGGGMPAFNGRLSQQQIDAVANYVAQQTGGS